MCCCVRQNIHVSCMAKCCVLPCELSWHCRASYMPPAGQSDWLSTVEGSIFGEPRLFKRPDGNLQFLAGCYQVNVCAGLPGLLACVHICSRHLIARVTGGNYQAECTLQVRYEGGCLQFNTQLSSDMRAKWHWGHPWFITDGAGNTLPATGKIIALRSLEQPWRSLLTAPSPLQQ